MKVNLTVHEVVNEQKCMRICVDEADSRSLKFFGNEADNNRMIFCENEADNAAKYFKRDALNFGAI